MDSSNSSSEASPERKINLPIVESQSDDDVMEIEESSDVDENSIEEILDNGDKYKAEGCVRFKLRVNKIVLTRVQEHTFFSNEIYIRGMKFRLMVKISGGPNWAKKHVGMFVQCTESSSNWSIYVYATLVIYQEIHHFTKTISHEFNQKTSDWGYSQIILLEKLLDLSQHYVRNNAILFEASIYADPPRSMPGVKFIWDSKKHTGHVGLKNLGATCYMNSILQTLFFTNKLRKVVYQMPTENDHQTSVALAMQRVFYELQFSEVPVLTRKLTKSFGWGSLDSFYQHDVQELCRVLLDNLESKMKSTQVADTIPNLFRGRMKSYVKCTKVDYESSREESFYDIQLNVKNNYNVMESFRDYTRAEMLEDENKYDAGDYGFQEAEKGVKFLSFPPVLHLHLMRFQYDPILDTNTKINDRYEFSDILSLNEFVEDKDGMNEDYTYVLHAVLVHIGTAQGGHYVVYIKTGLNDENASAAIDQDNYSTSQWFKFNDEIVSKANYREAVLSNFGGDQDDYRTHSFTNAYMLVYIRKSLIGEVLCPVTEDDIPMFLKNRFESEKLHEEQIRKQKEDDEMFAEIILVTEENMRSYHGMGLFDENSLVRMKVNKADSLFDLYDFVAINLGIPTNTFRLWSFHNMTASYHASKVLPSYRPYEVIPPVPSCQIATLFATITNCIFLEFEIMDLDLIRMPGHSLYFLKYYNYKRRLLEYKGCIMLEHDDVHNLNTELSNMKILQMLGVSEDTNLRFSFDISPNIYYFDNLGHSVATQNGIIICAEEINNVTDDNSLSVYYDALFYNVPVVCCNMVRGFAKEEEALPPFTTIIDVRGKAVKVCEIIGNYLKHDPANILLWGVSNVKPNYILQDDYDDYPLNELLDNPFEYSYNQMCLTDPKIIVQRKLYYSLLPISRLDYTTGMRSIRINIMNRKFNMEEITVFVSKNGKLSDLLDEAIKKWPFAGEFSGKLRCIQMQDSHQIHKTIRNERIMQVMNFSYVYHYRAPIIVDLKNARLEEIPPDQVELNPDERLVSVVHFDRNKSKKFGIPFFVKIQIGETASIVCQRIFNMLNVEESDHKKYKFTFETRCDTIQLDPESEEPIDLSNIPEDADGYLITSPYIGVNHFNKMRGMSTGNGEKSIVIHN